MSRRVHRVVVIDIVQRRIAFEQDRERELIAEREIRPSVGKRVCALLIRDVEGRAHPLARLLQALERARIHAGCHPQRQLLRVRAGFVSARDERAACRNRAHGVGGGRTAPHACRIVRRTDDDEVVVHDATTVHEIARIDEALLGLGGMDEHGVGIAARRHAKGSARADGNDLYLDACLLLEPWHDHVEETAVLRAGRRRQDD
jgi:hypothetical protein